MDLPKSKTYNLAIVGGGILGTTLAYWLATIYETGGIVVIEKENDTGLHATKRNTGVVHRPFYLDPEKKKIFARSALLSFPLWEKYASLKQLPWVKRGTLEVALNEADLLTLKKYQKWSAENGMDEKEIELLDSAEAKKMEPNIECRGAFFCKTDVATDFYALTKSLRSDAENDGVEFLLECEVKKIKKTGGCLDLALANGKNLSAKYVLNCAGGQAVKIAHLLGVARDLTDLNFRGEYWIVDPARAGLANHNIYSVPRHSEFPFLDPHWISRWDDQVEIGPTAVPVLGPYAYKGFFENPLSGLKKVFEMPLANKIKLMMNHEFLRLALEEWQSSFFKEAMVRRVRKFLPGVKPEYLTKKGSAGIRSPVIDRQGKFVKEALEIFGHRSFHVLNFNSPGATGAPAYTAHLIKKLRENHCLDHLKIGESNRTGIWDFARVASQFSP
ncbi:MAG: FAD-dependent oxidoreductase [bacterium]|nr:FAD-dependent oxidoreductase [bacterium]